MRRGDQNGVPRLVGHRLADAAVALERPHCLYPATAAGGILSKPKWLWIGTTSVLEPNIIIDGHPLAPPVEVPPC